MPLMSWPGIQPSSLLRNDRNSPRLSENACTATSASRRLGAGSGTCRSSTEAYRKVEAGTAGRIVLWPQE
jgi:hypothetical protein